MDCHCLVECVDKALYRAKYNGRNMVIVSDDTFDLAVTAFKFKPVSSLPSCVNSDLTIW
jgi:hypothetical protein